MTPMPPNNGAAAPVVKRARNTAPLVAEASKEAKRLAAVILEVLAGARTPLQAAEVLGMSLPRYYQVEARGLRGLIEACTAKPQGRQPSPVTEIARLQRECERLRRELSRHQSLMRMQRSLGLPPPAMPGKGKKGRQRKPAARALSLAARLRQEAGPNDVPIANDGTATPLGSPKPNVP
jgi:hypothetical protein